MNASTILSLLVRLEQSRAAIASDGLLWKTQMWLLGVVSNYVLLMSDRWYVF
jgi:hypothetical protein